MMTIHAQILKRNGKNEFAVLSYEEFLKIQEILDNYADLKALRLAKAKEKNAKTVSLKEAKKIIRFN
ncbi:MAG: type II toxin-antitoxin system Phd/YefM family antitoxin [Candidatus Omnitrophica bacterium]|nr:type II toxin-antitoxin system Phd/YefM family antitoxin [Candidatus Omnitrophota bacterium]